MKCSNDQTEMEKGITDMASWLSGDVPLGKGFLKARIKFSMWPIKRRVMAMTAYRCPKCGKVELYTEMEKK